MDTQAPEPPNLVSTDSSTSGRRTHAFLIASWLVAVYWWMDVDCEGLAVAFLLGIPLALSLPIALGLAAFRKIRASTFILFVATLVSSLPAFVLWRQAENHLAAEHLQSIESALERHRSDHGVYPTSLDKLTPRYIPTIPSAWLLMRPWEPEYSTAGDAYFLHYQLVCGPEAGDAVKVQKNAEDHSPSAPARRSDPSRAETIESLIKELRDADSSHEEQAALKLNTWVQEHHEPFLLALQGEDRTRISFSDWHDHMDEDLIVEMTFGFNTSDPLTFHWNPLNNKSIYPLLHE